MDGKFCVTEVSKDKITGQLITARSNRESSVSRYRFPISPKVGDVFNIDMGVGSSFAVTSLDDETKAYYVPIMMTREYTGTLVIPAKSAEEALIEAQNRAAHRPAETALLLYPEDTNVEATGEPNVID